MIILISLRKDDVQSRILSSLSLLVNAVLDERYINDYVNGRLHNLLFWDIFYVTTNTATNLHMIRYTKTRDKS